MEDFYPFTSENIPELRPLVQESLTSMETCAKIDKRSTVSYLLPLAIDLLNSVERIRALKNAFDEEYGGNEVKISDGFWKVVEAYLEINNGTGNLLRLMETLSLNNYSHLWDLEKVFLRYSLPASDENANIYSLSRDFLQAEKNDIAGNSVSVRNTHSVEQALGNSVILEEIFKKLRPVDQKSFRLVSATWMEETFSFWRRNAKILIHVPKENPMTRFGILLPLYMDLWQKNKKMAEGEANSSEKQMQRLQGFPFHSYRLWYDDLFPFSCGQMENDFWKSCGHLIENLEIEHDSPKFKANICKKLLQECQNLKRLEINCFGWEKEDSLRSTEETEPDDNNETKNMKIAKHLHTLSLGSIKEAGLRSVLFICPNLKTLELFTEYEAVGALLSPTSTGEFIKLKKLVLWSFPFDDSLSLRQYTEMLARNKFDCLEHLKLTTYLFNARSPPFNLYAGLAHASKNLKTLELKLCLLEHEDEVDNLEFMDLSPFSFPNLTEFTLTFEYYYMDDDFGTMKFDFGTLKGMPMLEKLVINVEDIGREPLRSPGAQDWVFEGDRNSYLPSGVALDYQYSAENPILCTKLKEFSFYGWSLNEEDARLISSWFPNLTHLEARMSPEALPIFDEKLQRLEKLVIYADKLISLRKLRPLKEKKKHLRIFQQVSPVRTKHEKFVELKEQNGWLFFTY